MTLQDDQDIQRHSPQKLMGSFAGSRMLVCLGIALAVHVIIVGGSSLDYIYYNWINREAGKARQERLEAERKAKADGGREAAETPAGGDAKAEPGAAAGAEGEEAMLEAHSDTPVVKRVTEKATPDEIPEQPEELGISLDDTNPF